MRCGWLAVSEGSTSIRDEVHVSLVVGRAIATQGYNNQSVRDSSHASVGLHHIGFNFGVTGGVAEDSCGRG